MKHGMHKMPNGMMMKNKEMEKMMNSKSSKKMKMKKKKK